MTMANQQQKRNVYSQIIVPVLLALLIGGSAPWWWEKMFPSKTEPITKDWVDTNQEDKQDSKIKPMDISGIWLTPFNRLKYSISQENNSYRWYVLGTELGGSGQIENNTLQGRIEGEWIVYKAVVVDNDNMPLVLTSDHPKYAATVLFRSCSDFKKYIHDLLHQSPDLRSDLQTAMASIPQPTCSNVFN
jgi:hypothetical protein